METTNELPVGSGLYEMVIIYQVKGKREKQTFAGHVLANNPNQAFKLGLNAIYIRTGKDIIVKDNILTLIIPDEQYFTEP